MLFSYGLLDYYVFSFISVSLFSQKQHIILSICLQDRHVLLHLSSILFTGSVPVQEQVSNFVHRTSPCTSVQFFLYDHYVFLNKCLTMFTGPVSVLAYMPIFIYRTSICSRTRSQRCFLALVSNSVCRASTCSCRSLKLDEWLFSHRCPTSLTELLLVLCTGLVRVIST